MNRRCASCRQKISMKLYDCRALMRRLGRIERSMQEVCRTLNGVGRRKRTGKKRDSCGKKHCGRIQEAKGRQKE